MEGIIIKKLILILIVLNLNLYGSNNYIIIADDLLMLRLFRDDKNEIINMAKDISKKYDGVILHLGNTVIFDKGGQFYYETSKKNLSEFINIIKSQNKKVYFWFFDTFGSKDFLSLYGKYPEVIQTIKPELEKYDFDGIVLDLEWINYNEEGIEIRNNSKLEEIIFNLENIFDKKVYNFASLIESHEENEKRGYDKTNYHKFFPMLYIKDGGFYSGSFGEPIPFINDNRIEALKDFYKNNFERVVVSLESGIILKKNDNYYFVTNFNNTNKDLTGISENLKKIREFNNKYYSIYEMEVIKEFKLQKNDESYENLEKNQVIYIFKTNKEIISEKDIVWEYFKFNDSYM